MIGKRMELLPVAFYHVSQIRIKKSNNVGKKLINGNVKAYLHKGDTGSSPSKCYILFIKDFQNPRQVDEHYITEKTSISSQTHLSTYFNRRISSSRGLFLKANVFIHIVLLEFKPDLLLLLSKSDLLLSETGINRGAHGPGLLTS